jgi:LDH2 family malate/lactate/ureidoglycolate dehydrogenase
VKDDPTPEARFAADPMLAWATDVLAVSGMPRPEAGTAAEVLVRTSLRGIDTHGISRLPNYAQALQAGSINPTPRHRGELRNGMLHYEGDRGLGQFIGIAAVRAAIEQAREQAVVTCLIHECGHLAALGAYVLVAAEAGMVAVMAQATQPWMALPGWTRRAIGNNPLAFAAPLPGRAALVFDMASSVVARGYLRQSIREGTPLPPGWAIGPDGEPTTDPDAAWAGAVLPVGGHKGLGLAMLVQTLSNSLQSNTPAVNGGSTASMGGFLMVLNPALIDAGFQADVDGWLATYLDAAGPDGRYPGERAAASETERRAAGIPVPPVLLQQLRDTGSRLGVPFALRPV